MNTGKALIKILQCGPISNVMDGRPAEHRIRRGKKIERKKEEETTGQNDNVRIYLLRRAAITTVHSFHVQICHRFRSGGP